MCQKPTVVYICVSKPNRGFKPTEVCICDTETNRGNQTKPGKPGKPNQTTVISTVVLARTWPESLEPDYSHHRTGDQNVKGSAFTGRSCVAPLDVLLYACATWLPSGSRDSEARSLRFWQSLF